MKRRTAGLPTGRAVHQAVEARVVRRRVADHQPARRVGDGRVRRARATAANLVLLELGRRVHRRDVRAAAAEDADGRPAAGPRRAARCRRSRKASITCGMSRLPVTARRSDRCARTASTTRNASGGSPKLVRSPDEDRRVGRRRARAPGARWRAAPCGCRRSRRSARRALSRHAARAVRLDSHDSVAPRRCRCGADRGTSADRRGRGHRVRRDRAPQAASSRARAARRCVEIICGARSRRRAASWSARPTGGALDSRRAAAQARRAARVRGHARLSDGRPREGGAGG